MFQFNWNNEKNKWLKKHREISFEEIVLLITNGNLIDIVKNPSANHPDQRIFVVDYDGYVYLVPFVKNKKEYFLKTIFKSRKATKKYLR